MEFHCFCLLIVALSALYCVRTESDVDTTTKAALQTCNCGIFLSGQFTKGSPEPPNSAPVLIQELDKSFACNLVGQRQCQSKCLETIVTHMPNSGSFICASLDRDCHKERAYLFVQNCNTTWINTGLSAGKEYCCKDGLPQACPSK